MYDTTIAAKLLNQLESFLGRISPHFHKPTARFIGDMIYGIMAQKDVKLSSVVRALKENITPKKVEDRLSRMLSAKGLEENLHDAIAEQGAKKVRKDTLIILDPSDVQKPYAKKMEYLSKVWDGSKGGVGDNLGFWGCMAGAVGLSIADLTSAYVTSAPKTFLLKLCIGLITGFVRFIGELPEKAVLFLKNKVFTRHKKEAPLVGNRFTWALGTGLNKVARFLNNTVLHHKKMRTDFEYVLDASWREIFQGTRRITSSLSFGLLLMCIGMFIICIYLLNR